MVETVKVRFGMISSRELELDVDDVEEVARAFDLAMAGGDRVLWVTDDRGHRHGIVLDKVAFLEIEKAQPREVGFTPQ